MHSHPLGKPLSLELTENSTLARLPCDKHSRELLFRLRLTKDRIKPCLKPNLIVIPFFEQRVMLDEEDERYRAGVRSGRPLVRTRLPLPQCLRHDPNAECARPILKIHTAYALL